MVLLLDDLHQLIGIIQKESEFPIHQALSGFLRSLKNWAVNGQDPYGLPRAFEPLFNKSTDILVRLAHLTPLIPKDQRNTQSNEKLRLGINQGLVLPEYGPDNLPEILGAALQYGSLEIGFTELPVIFSHWVGALAGVYEFVHRRGGIGFPFEVCLSGDSRYPWPIRDQIESQFLFLLDTGAKRNLIAPFSWNTTEWLLFEMLYGAGIGPFSKSVYSEDLPITWLLSESVIDRPADRGIELSRYSSGLKEQITIAMSVDSERVTFRYQWRKDAECHGRLKSLLVSLCFAEFLIDATLDIIEKIWKRLRGENEKYITPTASTIKAFNKFTTRYEKIASMDKPFRRNLRGIGDDIHPLGSSKDISTEYKSLEARLNKWRSSDFNIHRGRTTAPAPSHAAVALIAKAEKEAIEVYKKLKSFLKRNPARGDKSSGAERDKITAYLHKSFRGAYCTPDNMAAIVNAAMNQFDASNESKLKSRAVSAILSVIVSSRLQENITPNTVRTIIESKKSANY